MPGVICCVLFSANCATGLIARHASNSCILIFFTALRLVANACDLTFDSMKKTSVYADGAKMAALRMEKGWTQEDLARRVGIAKKTVENAESSRRVLEETLKDIAQAFGVNYLELELPVEPSPGSRQFASPVSLGIAPYRPSLVIGREQCLLDLKKRLGIIGSDGRYSPVQVLTAIRGFPGIGKTTVAAALAHDPDISMKFRDGILWTSLGQKPNIWRELAAWGRSLGLNDLLACESLNEASGRLGHFVKDKRMLIIVDDVWTPTHAAAFQIGGPHCATLVTTRETSLANAIAPTAKDVYTLPVLTSAYAIELLRCLAPNVVRTFEKEALLLVSELEGLPLAIQVAGRLLNTEEAQGRDIPSLFRELTAGSRILDSNAPLDRSELASQTIPTVRALLKKSTDRLDDVTRERFAYLSVFPAKPASWDLRAMENVWRTKEAQETAAELVDRGLVEYAPQTRRYQMHALLVLHAKTLCSPE